MKLYPPIHTLVKRFYFFFKNAEKMFDYCSGIFIILFLWGHHFFLPFPFSLPQFTFTLLPLLQSSAGNALFSPQEFYDSLTECWDTKHSSSAGKDCGTGLTNRDTKIFRNEEREMEMERWGPNFTTCYLKLFPNVTGSAHLASRGPVVSHVPALPSCAPIWGWWAISHMLNGSQQSCSICSVSFQGWICIFLGQ